MEIVLVIFNVVISLLVLFVFAYIKKKASNAADSEDIKIITNEIEKVKVQYTNKHEEIVKQNALILEEVKSRNELHFRRISEFNKMCDQLLLNHIEDINTLFFDFKNIKIDSFSFSIETDRKWHEMVRAYEIKLNRVEMDNQKINAFLSDQPNICESLNKCRGVLIGQLLKLYNIKSELDEEVKLIKDLDYYYNLEKEDYEVTNREKAKEHINVFYGKLVTYYNEQPDAVREYDEIRKELLENIRKYYEEIHTKFYFA